MTATATVTAALAAAALCAAAAVAAAAAPLPFAFRPRGDAAAAGRGLAPAAAAPRYAWKTRWLVGQRLDHFGFVNDATFDQKYLVNTDHYRTGGPVLFYCGNEDEIESFANEIGLIWETAPMMGAAVVFAQHRYYDASARGLPFGNATFDDPAHLEWLTSEQALADYVSLIGAMRQPGGEHYLGEGAERSAFVAFGGSYGGLLAAYIRIKYPNVVAGSLAASAPLFGFFGASPDEAGSAVVTRTFEQASHACPGIIRSAWDLMLDEARRPGGLASLSQTFSLCGNSTLASVDELKAVLFERVNSALFYMAMADYPYPANVFGPLPANPPVAACALVEGAASPVEGLARATAMFYNYTGLAGECFQVSGAQPHTFSANMLKAWSYQACTEFVLNLAGSSDGVHDMFYPEAHNMTAYMEQCRAMYGVTPRPSWAVEHYAAGNSIEGASNIVFSNGLKDPCYAGAVVTNRSSSLIALNIPVGAHHTDLFASNPADPYQLTRARDTEREWIAKFVAEWDAAHRDE